MVLPDLFSSDGELRVHSARATQETNKAFRTCAHHHQNPRGCSSDSPHNTALHGTLMGECLYVCQSKKVVPLTSCTPLGPSLNQLSLRAPIQDLDNRSRRDLDPTGHQQCHVPSQQKVINLNLDHAELSGRDLKSDRLHMQYMHFHDR